jgi:hypothetical protein
MARVQDIQIYVTAVSVAQRGAPDVERGPVLDPDGHEVPPPPRRGTLLRALRAKIAAGRRERSEAPMSGTERGADRDEVTEDRSL